MCHVPQFHIVIVTCFSKVLVVVFRLLIRIFWFTPVKVLSLCSAYKLTY